MLSVKDVDWGFRSFLRLQKSADTGISWKLGFVDTFREPPEAAGIGLELWHPW